MSIHCFYAASELILAKKRNFDRLKTMVVIKGRNGFITIVNFGQSIFLTEEEKYKASLYFR